MESVNSCIVLIASLPERERLLHRSLTTVSVQTKPPDQIVIVGDGGQIDAEVEQVLGSLADRTHCLINQPRSGAADAWNLGIRYIADRWPQAYIAILDDDDEWDIRHLEACWNTANEAHWPDAVVSGLRMIRDGIEQSRDPLTSLSVEDFLVGNPGWQGSNTFIRLSTLLEAGAFTSGLMSCNDRDLAIRVLSVPKVRIAYTGVHSACWHLDTGRDSLSSKSSEMKLDGLGYFYQMHGNRMSETVRQAFFERAAKLFGWQKEQIRERSEHYG